MSCRFFEAISALFVAVIHLRADAPLQKISTCFFRSLSNPEFISALTMIILILDGSG